MQYATNPLRRVSQSMLRGRGGCYKHTFYGIESHRCMEATPSLACANKCVKTTAVVSLGQPWLTATFCLLGLL
ncbi:unnamed protein product [Darwinula stevensoni]|uniref:Uncharacterized protein n=1 Tax=Darwinula stevensoni TaxID=69355 RepID=A0A7R9FR80_9CRUS|nr:unnamed protein product [Darwinula stevensoni]CAG0901153.1 unnamed protein product [Darwinula stevensoni]